MCPENAVFTQQNPGEGGSKDIYYMTFKVYAPDNAVTFKEGDRGVVVDEMHDFSGPSSGVDQYGRKYSVLWLGLASYSAATDKWSYYGKGSTTKKYIGWSYIVEWYDKDGVLIS
jgi:hypothetical protein